jgi:hypothetical protein
LLSRRSGKSGAPSYDFPSIKPCDIDHIAPRSRPASIACVRGASLSVNTCNEPASHRLPMRCRVTVEPQKAEEQWGNTVVVGLLSGDFPGGLGSLRYSSPRRLSAFPVQTRAVQPDWSRAAPDPAHSGRILTRWRPRRLPRPDHRSASHTNRSRL